MLLDSDWAELHNFSLQCILCAVAGGPVDYKDNREALDIPPHWWAQILKEQVHQIKQIAMQCASVVFMKKKRLRTQMELL